MLFVRQLLLNASKHVSFCKIKGKVLFKNCVTPEGGGGWVRLCYDVLQGEGGEAQMSHNKVS